MEGCNPWIFPSSYIQDCSLQYRVITIRTKRKEHTMKALMMIVFIVVTGYYAFTLMSGAAQVGVAFANNNTKVQYEQMLNK